ncbi:hypothetical protein [Paenibacillus polymyxa]|uniref:hypothetical protein n=1 Tax=Paenibacillus polymyxa TaxID=1406 RepID=UPI002AB5886A|nr:hypothetical protein [Paenibacillus polymyxa]MDY8023361.1 hypothetical protein [Paenibacillus polymyxa]
MLYFQHHKLFKSLQSIEQLNQMYDAYVDYEISSGRKIPEPDEYILDFVSCNIEFKKIINQFLDQFYSLKDVLEIMKEIEFYEISNTLKYIANFKHRKRKYYATAQEYVFSTSVFNSKRYSLYLYDVTESNKQTLIEDIKCFSLEECTNEIQKGINCFRSMSNINWIPLSKR